MSMDFSSFSTKRSPHSILSAASSTVLARSPRWHAPGHNSILTDAAGQDWMFYHAIDPAKPKNGESDRRVMLMDRVTYRNGWPVISGGVPSAAARPAPKTPR